jgi:23S rRNA pseudouridine2605 synthase
MAIPKTKKTTAKKAVKSKKTAPLKPESTEPKLAATPNVEIPKIEDPIGDETDGEAKISVDQAAEKLETESALYHGTTSVVPQAQQKNGRALAPEGGVVPEGGGGFNPGIKPATSTRALAPEPDAAEPEFTPAPGAPADGFSSVGWKPRPPAKLERLQKILAAAGVASRRSAEAMIEQGRVQVNGKVVTVLGTKADAARDHIRVDGKLLQGPERHRYFVLNKPRGFVTTVKDPEGRPTVMQFFDKMKERLYPVGRLDYMSEGLLVVTNDGELANRLTKASSGVEKIYLVKVAGQPTEAELDILRAGVAIERGKPGSPPVRTSPARIRQVRQGDNPWYEVVLIEGRNRELRKMFEEVGHFVEKIRRTGYGPLILDQEPGNLRELQPQEVAALRQAAEGKLRTPKSKELRRRNLLDAGLLPTVLPKPSSRPRAASPLVRVTPAADRPAFRPKKFGPVRDRDRTSHPTRPSRPSESFASGAANKLFRPARPSGSFDKNEAKPFRPARPSSEDRPYSAKPAWKKPEHRARSTGEGFRPAAGRPFILKPAWKKPERPAPDRSALARHDRSDRPDRSNRPTRPEYKRPSAPLREAPARAARIFDEDLGPVRPPNLHIEEITASDRPSVSRPSIPRASYSRPTAPRPTSDRPNFARPARREGGLTRPFTTSSGKPRAGGARPSSKSGKPFKHVGRTSTAPSRPYTPRTDSASDYRPTKAKPYPNSASRAERKAGPDWKPKSGAPTDRSSSVGWKPRYGPGKPATGSRSKPKPGSSAKPSHRVRSGAPTDRSSSVGWKSGAPTDRSSSVGWKPGAPTDRSSSVGWKPSGKKRH